MSNEKGRFNSENSVNHEALAKDAEAQQERLRQDRERNAEKHHESLEESARHEALEQAAKNETETRTKEKAERSPLERTGPTKRDKEKSYQATMNEVRSHMTGPSRAFSRVIHNPVVERVSDTVGSTVARPNAILSGALFAFLFTLGIYLVARMNGYPLTGTESIAAFVLGWILGNVFDFFKVMVTGKR